MRFASLFSSLLLVGCGSLLDLESGYEADESSTTGGKAGASGAGAQGGASAGKGPGSGGAGTGGAGTGGAGTGGAGNSGAGVGGAGTGGAGTGGAGTGGAGNSGVALARPPARTGEPLVKNTGGTRLFILKNIDYGYRDSNGDPLPDDKKGKSIGFDFDGKCTVKDQPATAACKSTKNSLLSEEGFYDGEGCIDNLFGGSLFPAISLIKSNIDYDLNNKVESQGAPTLIFELLDVDDGPDDTYVPANVYVAAHVFDGAPTWTPGSTRIIDIDSVDVFDPQGKPYAVPLNPNNQVGVVPQGYEIRAKLRSQYGYITNNVWVSGPFDPQKGVVEAGSGLLLGGVQLKVQLPSVLVTFDFVDDKHKAITRGTYGGVIPAQELKKALPEFLGNICIPAGLLGPDVIQQVASTSDILSTLPFVGDPAASCDALTIGLGLNLVPITLDGQLDSDKNFEPYVGKSKPMPPCNAGAGAGGASGAGAGILHARKDMNPRSAMRGRAERARGRGTRKGTGAAAPPRRGSTPGRTGSVALAFYITTR